MHYRTRCDTETVLHLYERRGHSGAASDSAACSRSRSGIASASELFLARDRLGVKPLYYVHTPDGRSTSRRRSRRCSPRARCAPALNMTALPDYLANHGTCGDDDAVRGRTPPAPGHTLVWRDGAISIERYWDLSFDPAADRPAPGPGAQSTSTRERFRESVRLRLMSDVPLGMFLSGGIDSAAITAMMSRLVDEPIKTFSVAFAEREANELAYARLVAQRYRTDHHEVIVTPDAVLRRRCPRLVWHEDEPIAHPSSVALYFVSRLAAEHVKVVLTGEGSDETLAAATAAIAYTVWNMTLGRLVRATAGLECAARLGECDHRSSLPADRAGSRASDARSSSCPADARSISTSTTSRSSDRRASRALLAPALHRESSAASTRTRGAHALLRRRDAGRHCSTSCSTPTSRRTCTSC